MDSSHLFEKHTLGLPKEKRKKGEVEVNLYCGIEVIKACDFPSKKFKATGKTVNEPLPLKLNIFLFYDQNKMLIT